ncbi:protein adenylyltransferase SelO family protein, partial [Falsiroseomonas sp.]|uniref:protein adenylyltransferase SelO family protein n=1 Tax=Falsiroseomonas sp. TaxID=2870721 RepID=UPI00271C7EEE
GRYAYDRQAVLAQWNLARLAETLLPLINPENPEAALPLAQEVIEEAPEVYAREWQARMAAKLGFERSEAGDEGLITGFLTLLATARADFTRSFVALSVAAQDDEAALDGCLNGTPERADWLAAWRKRLAAEAGGAGAAAARMAAVNPIYIARNHLVEAALEAAHSGDLAPTHQLLDALGQPFTRRDGFEALEHPAPAGFGPYTTFCGT